MKNSAPRRIALKEEFSILLESYKDAIRLQQLQYWAERTRTHQEWLEEEFSGSGTKEYGWFYKSAREFAEECMMPGGKNAALAFFENMVNRGIIERRASIRAGRNEYEYRLNLIFLIKLINAIGYVFESTHRDSSDRYIIYTVPKRDNARTETGQPEPKRDGKTGGSYQNGTGSSQNGQTLTEITSEITITIWQGYEKLTGEPLPYYANQSKYDSDISKIINLIGDETPDEQKRRFVDRASELMILCQTDSFYRRQGFLPKTFVTFWDRLVTSMVGSR